MKRCETASSTHILNEFSMRDTLVAGVQFDILLSPAPYTATELFEIVPALLVKTLQNIRPPHTYNLHQIASYY
jgi:hypothetical protein